MSYPDTAAPDVEGDEAEDSVKGFHDGGDDDVEAIPIDDYELHVEAYGFQITARAPSADEVVAILRGALSALEAFAQSPLVTAH